ncbi:TRAP transporter large permease [Celeribacter sp.]|uniref:TRAP transporter large permease n=1 Tax=Celeribacter sp. TaxID=1890673 RepID=UPI003A8EB3C8
MSSVEVALAVLVMLVAALGFGVWIFIALLLVSVASLVFMLDFTFLKTGVINSTIILRASSAWELSAIPLFVWMGELIFRTDIARRLFNGLAPIANLAPGRMLHTNIMGCTLFAAVCGSSAATTATVGKITIKELKSRGYDETLAIGSLAGAGSLGLLIPPSIVMIVYGVLAEVSVAKLFAAGILPGLLIAGLYSGYVMLRAAANPALAPAAKVRLTLPVLARSMMDLLPVGILVVLVLGSIYSGIATPTEAAAVGVFATLVLTGVQKQLSWSVLYDSLYGAIKLSAVICSLLAAAAVLSTTMGYLRVPQQTSEMIARLDLGHYQLILVLAVFYIILGLFLDGVSITVMSLPITLPLIVAAGIDPLWFGVFLVVMIELGQITPPIGFNLFILQRLTDKSILTVAWYAFPFFVLMCIGAALLAAFPQIALWLPELMTAAK